MILFTVSMFYQGHHEGTAASDDLWQESIVLVRAVDEAMAERVAVEKCAKTFTYTTIEGKKMTWTFDSIQSVFRINSESLDSGIEVFSRFLRPSEAVSLKTPFED